MPASRQQPAKRRYSYTIPEAAYAVGVSRATFYRRVRDGQVKVFKWGGRTLVHGDELQRVVDALAAGRSPKDDSQEGRRG
jgi:excisionase family DNA binding protein